MASITDVAWRTGRHAAVDRSTGDRVDKASERRRRRPKAAAILEHPRRDRPAARFGAYRLCWPFFGAAFLCPHAPGEGGPQPPMPPRGDRPYRRFPPAPGRWLVVAGQRGGRSKAGEEMRRVAVGSRRQACRRLYLLGQALPVALCASQTWCSPCHGLGFQNSRRRRRRHPHRGFENLGQDVAVEIAGDREAQAVKQGGHQIDQLGLADEGAAGEALAEEKVEPVGAGVDAGLRAAACPPPSAASRASLRSRPPRTPTPPPATYRRRRPPTAWRGTRRAGRSRRCTFWVAAVGRRPNGCLRTAPRRSRRNSAATPPAARAGRGKAIRRSGPAPGKRGRGPGARGRRPGLRARARQFGAEAGEEVGIDFVERRFEELGPLRQVGRQTLAGGAARR